MRKQLLFVLAIFLFVNAKAQSDLRKSVRSGSGITNQFTLLNASQQTTFNASQLGVLLGLDSKSGLVLKSKEPDALGFVHYRFYQTYMGIPVQNSMYVVHTKNSKIISFSGAIVTEFSASMASLNKTSITKETAIKAAINSVKAKSYMWQDVAMEKSIKSIKNDIKATYYPSVKLVWYNDGDDLNPSSLRLAYSVDVYAKEPSGRAYYFIDAQNGNLLGKQDILSTIDKLGSAKTLYSSKRNIRVEKLGVQDFRLHDVNRGKGITTFHADGSDYTNTSLDFAYTGKDQNALDAHWGVEKTYDYYKENFNRNSLDDSGYALVSYVNKTGTQYNDNANWDGTAMNYGIKSGTDSGVTSIDVTGHELTHGVTQFTCALVYKNEPGAMNESISDMAGKSVQFNAKPGDKSWVIGNDMNYLIRDMSNPKAFKQPNTYKGQYWLSGGILYYLDNGGVHTNSGVGNYMFYLLAAGGSGTNDNGDSYAVTKIGLAKADQVIYRAQTVYLTTTSKYADFRVACINAATDLYGASSAEVAQVKNAWYAVGIGAAALTGAAPQTPPVAITNISAMPNPVTSYIKVQYSLQQQGNVMLRLVDVNGLAAATYRAGKQDKGTNTFSITNIGALHNGYYNLVIEQENLPAVQVKILVSH